jgi:hypothetical protein
MESRSVKSLHCLGHLDLELSVKVRDFDMDTSVVTFECEIDRSPIYVQAFDVETVKPLWKERTDDPHTFVKRVRF